jgi:integrase
VATGNALSLMTGIRTEEARALTWEHVDLGGDPAADPPVPPNVAVWRSVRAHGDTKTERSKRTLAMPEFVADALREHRARVYRHGLRPVIRTGAERMSRILSQRS